jgi:hypothetical protein
LFKIRLSQVKNKYEYEELIKVFLKSGEYRLFGADEESAADEPEGVIEAEILVPDFPDDPGTGKKEKDRKNQIKRFLYKELQRYRSEERRVGKECRAAKIYGRNPRLGHPDRRKAGKACGRTAAP